MLLAIVVPTKTTSTKKLVLVLVLVLVLAPRVLLWHNGMQQRNAKMNPPAPLPMKMMNSNIA